MNHRELEIETWVGIQLERWDPDIVYAKLTFPGVRGAPDRLLLWENRGIMFVEFKKPGEKPTKMQKLWHYLLTSMGFEVQVHDNGQKALKDIMEYVEQTKRSVRPVAHADPGHEGGSESAGD